MLTPRYLPNCCAYLDAYLASRLLKIYAQRTVHIQHINDVHRVRLTASYVHIRDTIVHTFVHSMYKITIYNGTVIQLARQ